MEEVYRVINNGLDKDKPDEKLRRWGIDHTDVVDQISQTFTLNNPNDMTVEDIQKTISVGILKGVLDIIKYL
eukprot:CAMPEP_0116909688 /NCGR_PEP_ID=MMETSP0467-20121206/14423_1 /TAXON_ID=283647 /ORGANISM="Mesodinium pulex, Strain SPMC105" /LENGTH=71 /DNA_ID=CAMNT_0004585091 /DNA_START=79 /DNA_END=294 /DNA_ORIENTATION=+